MFKFLLFFIKIKNQCCFNLNNLGIYFHNHHLQRFHNKILYNFGSTKISFLISWLYPQLYNKLWFQFFPSNNNFNNRNPENKNGFIYIFQLIGLINFFIFIFRCIETIRILESGLIHLILWYFMISPPFNFFFWLNQIWSILSLFIIEHMNRLVCTVQILNLLIALG